MVKEESSERRQWVNDEPGFYAPVHQPSGKDPERPFPGEAKDTEEEIYDLEDGYWLNGPIEILGKEVPEDLGPEEAF